MNKHLKYMWYVIRHKYYVLIECFKVGLYWRGIMHDWSKFLPSELIPYANFFNGPKPLKRSSDSGYYKPTDTNLDNWKPIGYDRVEQLKKTRNKDD